MPHLSRRPRCFALAGVALASIAIGRAQESGGVRSPFLPSNYGVQQAAPAAATPLDALELRGVMQIGDQTLFTFFDPAGNRSIQGGLNETLENGMKISDLKEVEGEISVTIEGSGRSRVVPMRKGTIVAAAAVPPPMPVQAGMPQGQPAIAAAPNAAANQISQMSDQEVRDRMQRVADEIRRRREMRRQMLENAPNQQGQPAAQPQPQR